MDSINYESGEWVGRRKPGVTVKRQLPCLQPEGWVGSERSLFILDPRLVSTYSMQASHASIPCKHHTSCASATSHARRPLSCAAEQQAPGRGRLLAHNYPVFHRRAGRVAPIYRPPGPRPTERDDDATTGMPAAAAAAAAGTCQGQRTRAGVSQTSGPSDA